MKYVLRDFQLSLFFVLFESDLAKMDQIGSNLIKLNFIEIYHQNFIFIYFLIRLNQICPKMNQNGSNLIKLDFWWNNHGNTSSDFQLYLFFHQIESDLFKIVNITKIFKFAIFINFISFSFLIARKSALEKTQLSDVLITDNLFW